MNQALVNRPLLSVEALAKSYGGRKVVSGLSFEVWPGEVVGLLGANGAGKTTAFYMTMGLIRPDAGRVLFQDVDVTGASIDKRARMGMGYLAQEPSIFRSMTVEQNILCILQTLDLTASEEKRRLQELLAELHLEHLAKERASALSGGERRRLEITRALVTHPTLLLLDEPFANIDPLSVSDLKQMIRHLSQKGISVLITDHNAREIFSIVERSYLISEGRVLIAGSAQQFLDSSEARKRYLGADFQL